MRFNRDVCFIVARSEGLLEGELRCEIYLVMGALEGPKIRHAALHIRIAPSSIINGQWPADFSQMLLAWTDLRQKFVF